MPLSELPDLRPSRSYDELMALSMRRGRRLKLRRRALQASPLAVAAAVAIALPLSGAMSGNDGLARVRTTPAQQTHEETTAPDSIRLQPAPPLPQTHNTVTATSPVAQAAHPAATPARSMAPVTTVPPTVPVQQPSSLPRQQAPVVLSFADQTGDATPSSAPLAAASDPALDVTHMRFVADSAGLTITMRLLGAYRTDGVYIAQFTAARSGCALGVYLGGSIHDGLYWTCAGSSGGRWLPGTPDPSSRLLIAKVPYSYFPDGVRSTDRLMHVDGQTQLHNAVGSNDIYDTAATAASFVPREA